MGCSGCNAKKDLDRPAMLGVYDWLNDIPDTTNESNIVEIRFKGTRKEFFLNEDGLQLHRDELVVLFHVRRGTMLAQFRLQANWPNFSLNGRSKNRIVTNGIRFTEKRLPPT